MTRLSSRSWFTATRIAGLLTMVGLLTTPTTVLAQTETIEYYGTDAIGSIRIVWDANGNMTARQDFTPFGEPVLQEGTSLPKEGFVGNETDAETNQDYFHARMLEARTGRFTRPDPIEDGVADPQAWNRYAYAGDNPLAFTDPNGLSVDCGNGLKGELPGDCELPGIPGFDLGNGLPGPCPVDYQPSGGPCGQSPIVRDPPPKKGGGSTCDPSKDSNCKSAPKCDPVTGANCSPSKIKALASGFIAGIKDNWRDGDYYGCLRSDLIGSPFGPVGTHAGLYVGSKAVETNANLAAGVYLHFTDGRFKAFGKFSKVLVPRLGGEIATVAEAADGLGTVFFDAEIFSAIQECSSYIK